MRSGFNVYIGFDPQETVAYHVLSHSILRRASAPVSITPLVRSALPNFARERGPLESTEFSISRFMVPSLSGFKGYSLFLDCDMLCLANVHELLFEVVRNPGKAVYVVKHDYTPSGATKFLGQTQTTYPRKNWSSVMLFNNERCKALDPAYVNTAHGLDMHRFAWLADDQIGELPREWNWLVGEYLPNDAAKILHYTLGGPYFPEYRKTDHADLWFAELDSLLHPIAA